MCILIGAVETRLPVIIQGGMGAGVSNWRLAQAVSREGQLGVVSGTALDVIVARRLQMGDPGAHIRRALEHFPFPRMAHRILEAFFRPEGIDPESPFSPVGMHALDDRRLLQECCVVGNYAEVFLAKEGHANPVGINYLEKIQLPHLASLYGAMLAGVDVVIMGAGIPIAVPGVLDALALHQPASYPLHVSGALGGETYRSRFDPAVCREDDAGPPPLRRPRFLPIVASEALAGILLRKASGMIEGFVIEGPRAGGHNAPPRGPLQLSPDGQPVYGPRDVVSSAVIQKLGLPFWLAGSYGSPERVREALAEGAAGVQVGTAFALCAESGLVPEVRRRLIRKALSGEVKVFTDPLASPTGFPFKVVELEGTLSEADVYRRRRRVCDLGFLREPYRRDDGTIGYRCPAEPEASFLAKGGKSTETVGRKCLCNALIANVGMEQVLANGTHERCLITMGDDVTEIRRFCTLENPEYSAADVIRVLLG